MSQELDNLEHHAAAIDAEIAANNTAPDPAAVQAQQIAVGNSQYQQLIRQCLGMLVVASSMPYPVVREHYTPEAVNEIAEAIIAICDEYGIALQTWIGEGGGKLQVWVRLAMAAGVPLMGVLASLKQQQEKTVENTAENPPEVAPA